MRRASHVASAAEARVRRDQGRSCGPADRLPADDLLAWLGCGHESGGFPMELGTHADELARGVVATMADSSTVLLVADGVLAPVAMHHVSGVRSPEIEQALTARYRLGEGIAGRVWQTGTGILISQVDTQALQTTAHVAARGFVRTTSLSSLMAVPITSNGKGSVSGSVIGVLVAGRDKGSPSFTEDDFSELQRVAALAASFAAEQ